jgi:hypothetical protein
LQSNPALLAQDLIDNCLRKKTRRHWNGDYSGTIFTKPKWMVIAPGFLYENSHLTKGDDLRINPEYCAEGGRLEETSVFKKRLQKTLDFVRDNNRPFWTNIVKEHTDFLNSIEE